MTIRQRRDAAPPSYPQIQREDSVLERVQREHELNRALEAARTLQDRLELAHLLGHVPAVRRIRDDLAGRLGDLVVVDDVQSMQEQLP